MTGTGISDFIISLKLARYSTKLGRSIAYFYSQEGDLSRAKNIDQLTDEDIKHYDELVKYSQKALQFIETKYLRTAEFTAYKLNMILDSEEPQVQQMLELAKKLQQAIILRAIG